jgi:hypothetical protein
MIENEFPGCIHNIKPKFTFDPKTIKEKIDNIESYIEDMKAEINLDKEFVKKRFINLLNQEGFWNKKLNNGTLYNLEKIQEIIYDINTTKMIFNNWSLNIIKLCEELKDDLK